MAKKTNFFFFKVSFSLSSSCPSCSFFNTSVAKKMLPRDYEKNNSSSDNYAQNAEVKDDLVR